jgi:catechol 2,3-dioxygenase-like lactoylglutathione lyase family enzyme
MSATSSGTAVTALRQVALTVSDVARSTAFYRDMIGLPFLFSAGPALAFLAIGSVRLMLASPEGDFKPGLSSVLYFKVDDIIGAHAEMSARGVSFVTAPHFIAPMPDHDLWLCDFKDPDGHTMALMSERPKGSS